MKKSSILIPPLLFLVLGGSICCAKSLPSSSSVTKSSNTDLSGNQSHHSEPLVEAIKARDIVKVKELLASGANPNERGPFGYTPLMTATIIKNQPLMQVLIEAGAEINELRENRSSALTIAVESNYSQGVALLLKYKADLNITLGAGETLLHRALLLENVENTRALLDAGANVNQKNEQGNAPLCYAVRNINLVTLLLQKGADVNIQNNQGETPLMIATRMKSVAVVKLLIASGANIGIQDVYGWTVHLEAKAGGCKQIIDILGNIPN